MANYLKNELKELIKIDSTLFDFIQEFALDGLWFWDAKTTNACWVNPKLGSVLGYTTNSQYETLLNNWQAIFSEKDFSSLLNNPSSSTTITSHYIHKDGKRVSMNCSLKFIYDTDGSISRVLGANILEHDLSVLVSNMTDLLISVNYYGIVTFVSPNVTELFQYEIDEIVGKSYIEFIQDEDIAFAIEAIRKTIATGTPFTNLEIRIKRKDGSTYWTNVNSSINPLNKETILVLNDITAKIDSLKQLKQAKELLEEISKVSNIGGWEYYPRNGNLFWSDITRKIYGLPTGFVPDLKNILNFFKPESKKSLINAIQQAIHKGFGSSLDLEIITATQQEIWLRSIIKADFIEGSCNRIYGTFQDIDQLKKAEISREKSRKLLKHLTKQVPGILYQFQLTDDGRYFFSYVSRQITNTPEMELLSPEEKTKALLKYVHPDDYQMVIDDIYKSAKLLTLKDIEFRIILPSKKERWLKTTSTPERLNDGVIWHGYMSDITDRKLAEKELKQTKNVLLETNQVARIGGWEADLNTNTAYWSEITREIYEVDEHYTTINVTNGINYYKEGYSRDTIIKVFRECAENGTSFDVEVQLITAKNREIWVRVIGKADFSIPTKKRVYGTFQDITEAKIAEVQLKRTKDLLEETNRVARVGGWSIDVASNTIYWSKVIKEIVKVPYDYEPSLEKGLHFYKEGLSQQLITDSVISCIQYGTPFEIELQVVSTEGEDIWVKAIGKAEIEEGKTKRVYGIFQDINQYKIAQQNAKNLQKLEILLTKEKELNLLKSRFISLTSHEFRTPLTGILGSAELLNLYLEKIENESLKIKMEGHISHITSQVDRLTGIVTDVLTLEKTAEGKTIVKLQAIAIKAFLESLTNELHINLRDNRKVKMILPEDEKEIFTDETLLQHIMNNLINNAFKYSRGVNKDPEIQLVYYDKYFIITVKDYGMGIPAKDQKHLFETFFRASNVISTEGTGLGLSIAKEFTEKLGGQINFVSHEGIGSVFTLKFPY